jgi:hypothetical protein
MFSTQRPNHPHSEAILPTSRVPSWSRLPVRPTLAALSVNLQQPVEHPQLSTITARRGEPLPAAITYPDRLYLHDYLA